LGDQELIFFFFGTFTPPVLSVLWTWLMKIPTWPMKIPNMTKYGNIVLTTTTGRRVRYHLCLLVRVGGYIVKFSFLKQTPVTSSTSAAGLWFYTQI
jgi:hypothetical protein